VTVTLSELRSADSISQLNSRMMLASLFTPARQTTTDNDYFSYTFFPRISLRFNSAYLRCL
jgi:hypothetical protein